MKKKNRVQTIILMLCTALSASNLAARELLSDRHFQNGLRVKAPHLPVTFLGTLQFQGIDPVIWTCAQWNSKSTITDVTPTVRENGWHRWEDENKEIEMGPYGAEDYDLLLGVNSIHEFNNTYRRRDEPWPALLVEQRLSPPGAHGPGCPPFDIVEKLQFHVEAKLGKDSTLIRDGYDKNLHAAHFLIYFTLQNLNKNSPGFGKEYIWLGVQLYDDRTEHPPLYINHDDGTQTLIYSIPYDSAATQSTYTKEWVNFDVDLYPHALRALQEAWNRGYLSSSHDLADYKIGGMNMGWEAPGLNIVDMKVRNISLNVEYRPGSGVWNFDHDLEGWEGAQDIDNVIWEEGGYLEADIVGLNPVLWPPESDLNFDISDIQHLYVSMNNNSDGTRAKIYFATTDNPGLSEQRAIVFPINPNDPDYTEYRIDMSSHPQWNGVLTKLRFDPVDAAGASGDGGWISIDYFKIGDSPAGVEERSAAHEFQLEQNYPNPFNARTTINYFLQHTSRVEVAVYNILGEKVAELVNATQGEGRYRIEWNASDFSSGVYYYSIRTTSLTDNDAHFRDVKKMILLK